MMIYMKRKGGVICIALLLVGILSITPAMGSMHKATFTTVPQDSSMKTNEMITIEVVDCTHTAPITKEITISKVTWDQFNNELQSIDKTTMSPDKILIVQLNIFKKYHLLSETESYESVVGQAMKTSQRIKLPLWMRTTTAGPILNNSIFSAMCAINFELTNGTTFVFGLNSFVNFIGFDIVSFHLGDARDGIETNGIFPKKTDPGRYVGFMFGFLGAWTGQKTSTGFYSNVTVAGFSVITAWLPVQPS